MSHIATWFAGRREGSRRCRDCGYPIPPRGRCAECGVPVTASIPRDLGIRARTFTVTALATLLLGTALLTVTIDGQRHMPGGSWLATPGRLILLTEGLALGFGLAVVACHLQLNRVWRAAGVRRLRPWREPVVPIAFVPTTAAPFAVARAWTYLGTLPVGNWTEFLVAEAVALFAMGVAVVTAVVMIGWSVRDLARLLAAIDRDWWRR